jgi:hypothetical protein
MGSFVILKHLRGPFEKFVDSPYYSESEICGGVVTVSFRSTSLGKRCTSYNAPPTSRKRAAYTVDHFEISCLGAPFSLVEKPRNRMRRDLNCMADVVMGFHRSTFSKPDTEFNSDLAPCNFWAIPAIKRELRGKKFRSDQRSAACFRKVGGALQEVPRLPREVLRKIDRHHTFTKFRLRVISWVHELCKRPSSFEILEQF